MNAYEKESLVKSFLLYFFSIELLLLFIAYFYYLQQVQERKNALFLEMKTVNYTLEGEKFKLDFVPSTDKQTTYTLYENSSELYTYFPIPTMNTTWLKMSYLQTTFDKELIHTKQTIALLFMAVTVITIILASLFSFYTLYPLRYSMKRMEEFLKDIIHDLNTPVTALMLNAQLLEKKFSQERVRRMLLSAKTIGNLHQNLHSFLQKSDLQFEMVDLQTLLQERIDYFSDIYENLTFESHLDACLLFSNQDALVRIADNLLSNACKYNNENGKVITTLTPNTLTIRDYGIGIKEPKKVFERFYKENERGLGIGLHIVQKLCHELNITIKIISHDVGTSFVLTLR